MKTCSKCLVKKPLDAFYKRLQSKDGRRGQCMECMDAYGRSRAEYLHSIVAEPAFTSEKICTACKVTKLVSEFGKWKSSKDGIKYHCKSCTSKRNAEHYYANPDLHKEKGANYYAANPEKFKRYKIKYMAANAESIRTYMSAYVSKNLDVFCAKNAKRRANKIMATPAWANHDVIRDMYAEAARLSRETGMPHHVDHIVPLLGPKVRTGPFKGERLVCGLHWEGNLQILTGFENLSKKNYFWPDMP